MVELLNSVLALTAMISAWTLGIRIISDKGMVLYPFRQCLLNFKKKEKRALKAELFQKQKEIKKALVQGNFEEMQKIEDCINSIEMDLFLIDWWHKPLLTCAPCMCSVHGLVVTSMAFAILGDLEIILVSPISILLSVVVNSFVITKYKKLNGLR